MKSCCPRGRHYRAPWSASSTFSGQTCLCPLQFPGDNCPLRPWPGSLGHHTSLPAEWGVRSLDGRGSAVPRLFRDTALLLHWLPVMNEGVQVSLPGTDFVSCGCTQDREWWVICWSDFQFFEESSCCFPQRLHQFTFPQTLTEPLCSHPRQHFTLSSVLLLVVAT